MSRGRWPGVLWWSLLNSLHLVLNGMDNGGSRPVVGAPYPPEESVRRFLDVPDWRDADISWVQRLKQGEASKAIPLVLLLSYTEHDPPCSGTSSSQGQGDRGAEGLVVGGWQLSLEAFL